jgi:hypothetical protein
MKKVLFPLLFAVSFFLVSCDFSGESNYTPGIFIMQRPITNNSDTLDIEVTGEQGLLLMDTIQVGDTVQFAVRFEAYANRLTALSLKHTPANAAKILLPPVERLDSTFNSSSDYDKGDFYLDPLYSTLFMVFSYVALEPGTDTRLEMTVISDAKFEGGGYGSNYAVVKIKTPVKP